jgi:hypothetical protein
MGDCICVRRGDGPEGCGICNETGTTPDIAGLCERLRAALEGVTPGDLDTSDHIGSGNYNCPCCEGEGAVEGKTFTNFDGFAIGVQFFGVGDEFAKYEAFFRAANPQTVRALLDTLERQAAENKRLRDSAAKTFADVMFLRKDHPGQSEQFYAEEASSLCRRALAALTGEG